MRGLFAGSGWLLLGYGCDLLGRAGNLGSYGCIRNGCRCGSRRHTARFTQSGSDITVMVCT
jgi:hypothetical protein